MSANAERVLPIRVPTEIVKPTDLVVNGDWIDREIAAGREILMMVTMDDYQRLIREYAPAVGGWPDVR